MARLPEPKMTPEEYRQLKVDQYNEALERLPVPGSGKGFHDGSFGVAKRGKAAGLTTDEVFRDLRRKADQGTRPVPDAEIAQTVNNAYNTTGTMRRKRPLPALPGPATRARIIEQGRGFTIDDIMAASPVKPPERPEDGARALLAALYSPEDRLFIGQNYHTGAASIKTAREWLERDATKLPHIMPNPLTGEPAPCKTDQNKMTFRGDNCISAFRFCLVEFDALPLADQVRFWAGVKLPVAALITSGGKSIHGWLAVNVPDADEWRAKVVPLYETRLVPLGVDGSCKNPSRLSRLPGHFRLDKGNHQRLIFCDPAALGVRHYLKGGE